MASKRSRQVEVPAGYAIVRDHASGSYRVIRAADPTITGMAWSRGEPTVREWPTQTAAASWLALLLAGAPIATMRAAWVEPTAAAAAYGA